MIRCVHLFTGADGRSHMENAEIPLGAVQSTKAAHFEESAAGSVPDWHTAPVEQYVVTLSGTLEFTSATASHSCFDLVMSCWRPIPPERGIAGVYSAISRGGASMSRLPAESEKIVS